MPLLASASARGAASAAYANVTLESPIMSARVFMPLGRGVTPQDSYYLGSRFEHGSMIGDINFGGDSEVYGHGVWRMPHDPSWPESGVGLASEFGCGDNGSRCPGKGDITNGLLGYEEAKPGEPFLKIGVGALVKGYCPECVGDANLEYKFNSPYQFHRLPVWKVLPSPGPNEITFVSEESLGDYGYRIQKTVRVDGNVLTVRNLLSNSGKKQFTTPWYSHHFFNGDDVPVGPGYGLDLGLSEYALKVPTPQFKQPGLGSWTGDIADYANVTMARDGSISMKMKKPIPEGVRLKADFLDEKTVTLTDGSFTLRAPNGVSVYEKIPELQTQSRNPFIYAYNVYMERGTMSPEPMLLLYLQPGETTVWTQHLKFTGETDPGTLPFLSMIHSKVGQIPSNGFSLGNAFCVFLAACVGVAALSYTRRGVPRRRFEYSSIPDRAPEQESGDVVSVV
ncbi:hypothetical protein ACHAXT_009757 [Thalassiosira profunda]